MSDPHRMEVVAPDEEARFLARSEAAGLGYLRFLALATLFACLLLIGFAAAFTRAPERLPVVSAVLGGFAVFLGLWWWASFRAWFGGNYRVAAIGLLASHFALAACVMVLDPFAYGGSAAFLASLNLMVAFFAFGPAGLPPVVVLCTVLGGAVSLLFVHEQWVPAYALDLGDEILTLAIAAIVGVGGYLKLRAAEARERKEFRAVRELGIAQAESAELARQAQHESKERARFLAAVSHDVRQPLTAMNLRLTLLRERLGTGDEVMRQHFDDLARGIASLGQTLSATLGLSQLQSRGENWPVEPVDIAEVVREIHATFRPLAAGSGVHLGLRVPVHSDACWVTTNREQLGMVVTNLVANALKFQRATVPGQSARSRFVLIAATRRGDRLAISVIDNGIGIAAEHQERIFEPYYQAANPERNRVRGIGLGLANVRAALRWLPGHELRLRSRLGRASRFTLTLPCTEVPWFVSRKAALLPTVVRLEGASVLVLEDDEGVRDGLVARLQAWGAHTIAAAGFAELEMLCRASDRSPELLISDFQLPGDSSGIDAIVRLREVYRIQIPAILISGLDTVAGGHGGEALPPDVVFMPKPLDSELLGREISRLLAQTPATTS